MKRFIPLLVVGLLLTFFQTGFSQIKANGWLQSSLYSWENINENQQWDFYQGFQFRVAPENYSNLYLNTFFRVAYRDDPAAWQERVYNLFLHWGLGNNYKFRVGRQFLYRGVINGTMDAVSLSGKFLKKFQAGAVIGTDVPLEKTFEIRQWEDGNVIGGYLGYLLPGRNSIEVSYFQKERWSEKYWQQLGSTFRGIWSSRLDYYARFDYNLLSSQYQAMRFRLAYLQPAWTVSAEYNSQRPRIYEDSFFNLFVVTPYNQLRFALDYKLKSYDLGLQVLHTAYNVSDYYILFKDDKDLKLVGSIGHARWGTFGLIFQTGSMAENIGYFADLRYQILPNLTARFFNSFYNYERATTNISEDALSFMAGLGYKLKNKLLLDGEIQQSSNNYYKNDLRGLVRITYLFQI